MIRQIGVRELSGLLNEGGAVHLLDVRQPWEHAIAHLPGSQLVPLPELVARVAEVQPAPDALLVAYCHHGVRSLDAAVFLLRSGHRNVASLAGGIDRWSLEIDETVPRY